MLGVLPRFARRLYHGRVRQSALHCLLAVVRGVDKRMLYGYWSSFIPDAPMAGPPPLTLLSIVLKDPSPKVGCSLSPSLSLTLSLTHFSSHSLIHTHGPCFTFNGTQCKNRIPLFSYEKGQDSSYPSFAHNYNDIDVHSHLPNRFQRGDLASGGIRPATRPPLQS